MNRRGFFAALAAPLIVRPSLEQIERLTWRRKFFPGWSEPLRFGVGDIITIADWPERYVVSAIFPDRVELFAPQRGYWPNLGLIDPGTLARHAKPVLDSQIGAFSPTLKRGEDSDHPTSACSGVHAGRNRGLVRG